MRCVVLFRSLPRQHEFYRLENLDRHPGLARCVPRNDDGGIRRIGWVLVERTVTCLFLPRKPVSNKDLVEFTWCPPDLVVPEPRQEVCG